MNTINTMEDRKRRLQRIIDLYTQHIHKNRLLAKRLNKNNIYVEMLLKKMNKLKMTHLEHKNIYEIEAQTVLMLSETNDLANDAEIIRLQQQIKQKLNQITKSDNELNVNVVSICGESDYRIICKKMMELIFTKHCTGLVLGTNKNAPNQINHHQGFVRNKDFELEELNLNNTNENQINEYWNSVSKGSNYLNEWDSLFFEKKSLHSQVE